MIISLAGPPSNRLETGAERWGRIGGGLASCLSPGVRQAAWGGCGLGTWVGDDRDGVGGPGQRWAGRAVL